MAIGDDDQDILLWNRVDERQQAHLHGSDYFRAFHKLLNAESHVLATNYRSVPEIVAKSQEWLDEVTALNPKAARLKSAIRLEPRRPEQGVPAVFESEFSSYCGIIPDLLRDGVEVAILCRTNDEVSDTVHQITAVGVPRELVRVYRKRSDSLSLAVLRDVNEWLELCRRELDHQDLPLSEPLFNRLMAAYVKAGFRDEKAGKTMETLWLLAANEQQKATLAGHVELIEGLDISEYERLLAREEKGKVIVSTIHKIKGLEFDHVFVRRSHIPFQANRASLEDCAAEEARTFYVAMTRAKNTLHFEWGERENSWKECRAFEGLKSTRIPRLEGMYPEVFLHWPGYLPQFAAGVQDYLRFNVREGDPVEIAGRYITHDGKVIGMLSSKAPPVQGKDFVVEAVVRYEAGESLRQNYSGIFQKVAPELRRKGWIYTALVRSR